MAEKLLYGVSGGKVKGATTVGYDTDTNQLVVGTTAGVLTTASGGKVSTSSQLSPSLGGTGASNSPASGHILVGNAGNTAYVDATVSGDASLADTGVVTVTGLRGRTVAATAPAANQVLKWSGSAWTPQDESGGGGGGGGVGGGLVYYLNYRDSATSPPAGTWEQMSATFDTDGPINTGAISVTPGGTEVLLAQFITEPNVPGAITIPPGVWDINLYGSTNNSSTPSDMAYIVYVKKYNGTGLTAIGNSDAVPFTLDTLSQYTATVQIPQTALSGTERIVIQIYGTNADTNSHTITTYFSGTEPSHVHTNISGVGGTGVVKVVAGVLQSPASKIIDSDIDASGISADKITSGTLPIARGGTGLDSVGASGSILISSGTALAAQAMSGDATINSSGVVTLANTAVTPTTYGTTAAKTVSITVDSKGRITSASEQDIAASLANVTGTLPVGNGGTGATSIATGRLIQGNGTSAFSAFAGSAAGQIPIWNNSTSAWTAATITGTTNQINVASNNGSITLSIPTTPVFTGLNLSGLTASKIVKTDASKNLVSADNVSLTTEVTGTLPVANGGTGASLLAGNGVLVMNTGGSAATSVPGTSGQYLVHNGTTWAAAAAPYDLSSEFAGKPSASQVIMNFVAATAFTLSTTAADHKFKCVTAGSSGSTVITITKVGSGTFATITYALGSTTGTVVITNSAYASISAGDLITATVTSVDAAFDTPYFTLKGTA